MLSPLRFRTALLKAARLLSQSINTVLEPYGIHYSLWQVLYVIQHQQQCTAHEISTELGVSKPSISKRINLLLEMQLIEQIETQDKRQKCLTLSSHGINFYQECSEKISMLEMELLEEFDSNDKTTTHQVLNQIVKKLNNRLEIKDE